MKPPPLKNTACPATANSLPPAAPHTCSELATAALSRNSALTILPLALKRCSRDSRACRGATASSEKRLARRALREARSRRARFSGTGERSDGITGALTPSHAHSQSTHCPCELLSWRQVPAANLTFQKPCFLKSACSRCSSKRGASARTIAQCHVAGAEREEHKMTLEGRGGQTRRAACGGSISVRILVRGHLPNFICRGGAACTTARALQNEPRHPPVACFFFAKTRTGGWLRGSGAATCTPPARPKPRRSSGGGGCRAKASGATATRVAARMPLGIECRVQDAGGGRDNKNMERNRSGISATISRCCRSCRLPEAAP